MSVGTLSEVIRCICLWERLEVISECGTLHTYLWERSERAQRLKKRGRFDETLTSWKNRLRQRLRHLHTKKSFLFCFVFIVLHPFVKIGWMSVMSKSWISLLRNAPALAKLNTWVDILITYHDNFMIKKMWYFHFLTLAFAFGLLVQNFWIWRAQKLFQTNVNIIETAKSWK